MDDRTREIWSQAQRMTGEITGQALSLTGLGGAMALQDRTSDVQATIAAAAIRASAQFFAALVEADLAEQIRSIKEHEASHERTEHLCSEDAR